jgi:hypothetical protein
MAEIADLALHVKAHWVSLGLTVRKISKREIVELSRSLPVPLPGDYVTFLEVAGVHDDDDRAAIRFWPPHLVRPTTKVVEEAGYILREESPSVIFADYMQESWWYGMWVGGELHGRVSIVLCDDKECKRPSPIGDFSEFLMLYLSDAAILYRT